ncbi:N-acetylglutamate synthase-like GNAT family acetyltransferase [Streptomyces albogriseolus]
MSADSPEVSANALTVRRARTSDVPAVRRLLDVYVREGILLDKATVTLYEDIQEFWVAERDDNAEVVGCGALHVMWEDLAEVRTLAVKPGLKGAGVGHRLLEKLLQTRPLARCSARFLPDLRSGLLRQARLRGDR